MCENFTVFQFVMKKNINFVQKIGVKNYLCPRFESKADYSGYSAPVPYGTGQAKYHWIHGIQSGYKVSGYSAHVS